MAAILRIDRVVDPNDRLFNRSGVQVNKTSMQRLVLSVGRNHSVLDRDNVIALSNKLHEWLNETAEAVDSADVMHRPAADGIALGDQTDRLQQVYSEDDVAAYLDEITNDPRLQCAVNGRADAEGKPRPFEPTEAGKQRFREMAAYDYETKMYGGKD